MKIGLCLVLILGPIGRAAALADDKPAGAPPAAPAKAVPEFKLITTFFEAGDTPRATADMLLVDGISYQFIREAPEEVVIIDPARGRLVLFDVKRNVRTEVDSARLDAVMANLFKSVQSRIANYEKSGTRSDRIMARKYRELIEPDESASFDPSRNRWKSSNETLQLEASGEADRDPERLRVIGNYLGAIAKLGAMHDPSNLTPFARLEAVRALVVGRGLRPTEISCVTRLSSPPQKLRWTFRVVPEVTERERLAASKITRALARTPYVVLDRYLNDE